MRKFKFTFGVIVDNSSKMADSKLCVVIIFGRYVDITLPMNLINLVEHGNISALEKIITLHNCTYNCNITTPLHIVITDVGLRY